MAYDYQGAIQAGAKPEDVLNYMSALTGYDSQGAIKAGANQDDVMKYMSALPSKAAASANNQNTQPAQDNNVGWLQGAVQGIASPFLNLGASAADILEGIGYAGGKLASMVGAPGAEEFAQNRLKDIGDINKGVSVPYLGTATPWGSALYDEGATGNAALKTAAQLGGDGLQIASWFTGMGETKTATQVGAEGMTQVAKEFRLEVPKRTFFQGVTNLVKQSLPFSIMQGVGAGLNQFSQDVGKESMGKNAESSLTTALMSTAGNVAGWVFMGGATGLLQRFGSAILKNPTVAAANHYMVDTMSKLFSIDPNFASQAGGQAMSHTVEALRSEVNSGVKAVVDSVADAIDTKASPDTLWSKITQKFSPWVDSLFRQRDESYKQLSIQNPQIGGGFKGVMGFLSKANDYLNSAYSGMYEKLGNSPLSQYVGWIESALGKDGTNVLSRTDIQSLIDKGDILGKGSGKEISFIHSLQSLLKQDSLSYLRSNPATQPLADLWEKGNEQHWNVTGFLKTKVAGGIQATKDVPKFIDSLFTGKAPSIEAAQQIVEGLGGKGSDALNSFSELIRNRLIQYARYANQDYTEGGKLINDFLDKWQQTGILTTKDIGTLRDFGNLMQNGYEGVVNGVKRMMDMGSPEGQKVAQQATGIAEKGTQLTQAEAFQKAVGDKPIFAKNPDVTFNMENAINALNKANTDGRYDSMIEQLQKLNPAKATKSQVTTAIKSMAKAGLGAAAMMELLPMMGAHIGWGASLVTSGLIGLIGLTKEQAGQLSNKEVTAWMSKLSQLTDEAGKPYITPSILTDFISGNYDKAFSQISKIPAFASGKVSIALKNMISPSASYSIDQYKRAAEAVMGRQLTSDEEKQLEERYAQELGQ